MNNELFKFLQRGRKKEDWNLIKCDVCGYSEPMTRTVEVTDLREEAKSRGWLPATQGRLLDLCPTCKEKL